MSTAASSGARRGSRAARGGARGAGLPAGYALAELAPTARRLLDAALRILERDGYGALTLRRIAAEAGETKSLIVYHFGGKDGLVTALVDSLWHAEDLDLMRRLGDLPDAPGERLRLLIELHHALALESPEYRMYFDLLPHLMRDAGAKQRHAELNQTYRSLGVMAIAGTGLKPSKQLALASLLLAADEGAGALLLLNPDGFDHEAAFALLQTLTAELAGVAPGGVAPSGAAPSATASSPALAAERPAPANPLRLTLHDPAADLPPVARRLLDGAIQVLLRDGLAKVTFEAVADASGEPRSATTYYYGEKRNLIVAVHDTLLFRSQRLVARRLRAAAGDSTRRLLVTMPGRVPGGLRTFRALFELFPAIVRDEALRSRHVEYLAWLRAALLAVSQSTSASPALVDLALTVTYGLPIQLLLDQHGVNAGAVLEVWAALCGSPEAQAAVLRGQSSSTWSRRRRSSRIAMTASTTTTPRMTTPRELRPPSFAVAVTGRKLT